MPVSEKAPEVQVRQPVVGKIWPGIYHVLQTIPKLPALELRQAVGDICGQLGKLLRSCSSTVTAQDSVVIGPQSDHTISVPITLCRASISRERQAGAVPPCQNCTPCLGFSPSFCRNSCSSSHGGSPGLVCAELETTSTGSTGTRLTQTRELRLRFLGER